jgi:ankyrin repeat protein
LYFAAKNGDTEAARQLLKGGCNPKLSDVNRNTPLHIATDGGHLEFIQLLIEYGL